MKVVIQRVSEASVSIETIITGSIARGLLILVGIEESDDQCDIDWLCQKIVQLRIFNDDQGIMNRSVLDTRGEILVVSQFTLHASTKKGNRPSYIKAARPGVAIPLYENFILRLETLTGKKIQTGEFGAMMQVSSVNDGPVTIIIDTKNKV